MPKLPAPPADTVRAFSLVGRGYPGFGESVLGQASGALQSAHTVAPVNVLDQRSFGSGLECRNEEGFSCRRPSPAPTVPAQSTSMIVRR